MSTDFEKVIKLLGETDGRDKIYKFLAGVFKILSAVLTTPELAKGSAKMNKSIGSARSIMRMGKFIQDIPKYRKQVSTVTSKGVQGTPVTVFIEFFRTIGNSLYILGDNIAFVAKHKLIAADPKLVTKYAKIAQFWGFFLAAVLDVFALRAALAKRAADAATSKKESKKALLSLAKDGSDTLVTMATVGYLKQIWHPNTVTAGALTCVSGGVATYLNWGKIK